MTTVSEHRHPAHRDLYTPVTNEMIILFERMKIEHGTYRRVCALSGVRMKVFRQVRRGKHKAVSLELMDKLVTSTGVGSLREFTWFTAEDLVALGIWKPTQYVAGSKRYRVIPGLITYPEETTEKNTLQEAKNRNSRRK